MKKSLGAKTLATPTPVWVVGSYGESGAPNIMTIAWGGICCSVPPCVAISLQKTRATYSNILRRKAFTINIPGARHAAQADYAGVVSGKHADKFPTAGLTSVKSELVDAPYVQEFSLVLECRVVTTTDLGSHVQFVGEILDVLADESVLGPDGMPDIEKIAPFVFNPGDHSYHAIGQSLGPAFSIGLKFMKNGGRESL
jgi:flavin reductase (DIM6/NTAB) family NADH-FMN oxidoreductase RutF